MNELVNCRNCGSQAASTMAIENAELLTDIFGDWPEFEDDEVVSIVLDKRGHGTFRGPTVEVKVLVAVPGFRSTGETDTPDGYVRRPHILVTLRFFQADELRLEGFREQNILYGLHIIDISDRQLEDIKFDVYVEGNFGSEMRFVCKAVSVAAAEPWKENSTGHPA